MKFFKYLLFSVFLSLLIVSSSLLIKTANAADAIPDGGLVPCEQKDFLGFRGGSNPEFNSDRPYQASPCGDAPKAFFCSNSIVMTIGSVSTPYCGSDVCNVNIHKKIDTVIVDLTNVNVPVLGNTQQIKNSVNSDSSIDDATRLNEYVSSYLNGTTDQAESGPTDINKVVDYSGPIKKLLPTIIQDAQRLETIRTIYEDTTNTDEDTGATTDSAANHNQIAVCADNSLGGIGDFLGIGTLTPKDCYTGGGAGAQGDEVLRLDSWVGDLSPWNSELNAIINAVTVFLPKVSKDAIRDSIGDHWNKRWPPLPWNDADDTNTPFKSDILYQKAYNEWRGQTCVIVPVINKLICIDTILVPNKYADLYPYIPLANTTDKLAGQTINSIEIQSGGRAVIDQNSKTSTLVKKPKLYFGHTQESADLSALLQKTFKAQPKDSKSAEKPGYLPDVEDNSSCQIVKSYTNPGDDATFDKPKSYFEIHDIEYTVTSIRCSNPYQECRVEDPVTGECLDYKTVADCSDDIYLTVPMTNKSPNLDEIWKNTVAGDQSIFRRIYPKTGENSPVSCIADIPGVSPITYTSETNIGINQVIEPDDSRVGSLEKAEKSIDAQYYFPHLGGISDYFLKGIQTALRPKGYGEPLTNECSSSGNVTCGDLSTLPKPKEAACKLGSVSSRIGEIPQSLKDIVSLAADTYKVPPNLILASMYGEGSFNKPPFEKFKWTDQNVKDWATCTPIPGCSDSAPDNWIGFDGYFQKIVDQSTIADDIKKFYPTHTKLSQCNLIDGIFAAAWNLHQSSAGGGGLTQCYGINISGITRVNSCDWGTGDEANSRYESAIKVYESGYTGPCLTLAGSCSSGGSLAAGCPNGDTCETLGGSSHTSHNACVWDVGHGK